MSTNTETGLSLRERTESLRGLLDKMQGQIKMALPRHLTPERMTRVVMTAVGRTPKLLECDSRTLIAAVMAASELGLEPSSVLGHAYLVPLWNGKTKRNEVNLWVGYKGLLELARRSGQISTIAAYAVHERDEYDYRLGLKPLIFHRPYRGSDAGDVVAFYAVASLKDGGVQFSWMWREDVDKVMKDSPSGGKGGPWASHYEEMGLKTVLRRLCKLLPSSTEMQRAIGLDEMAEAGIQQRLDVEVLESSEIKGSEAAPLDAMADALEAEAETVES